MTSKRHARPLWRAWTGKFGSLAISRSSRRRVQPSAAASALMLSVRRGALAGGSTGFAVRCALTAARSNSHPPRRSPRARIGKSGSCRNRLSRRGRVQPSAPARQFLSNALLRVGAIAASSVDAAGGSGPGGGPEIIDDIGKDKYPAAALVAAPMNGKIGVTLNPAIETRARPPQRGSQEYLPDLLALGWDCHGAFAGAVTIGRFECRRAVHGALVVKSLNARSHDLAAALSRRRRCTFRRWARATDTGM